MSYYFIANYDVTDPEMYAEYGKVVRPTIKQYGGKLVVVDREPNDIEGESRHVLIILQFESEEAFKHWYNSPEYQAIINLRLDATEGWARGAESAVRDGRVRLPAHPGRHLRPAWPPETKAHRRGVRGSNLAEPVENP